jgi:hypothetical protein
VTMPKLMQVSTVIIAAFSLFAYVKTWWSEITYVLCILHASDHRFISLPSRLNSSTVLLNITTADKVNCRSVTRACIRDIIYLQFILLLPDSVKLLYKFKIIW